MTAGPWLKAQRLRISSFGKTDPLAEFESSRQGQYLRRYLAGLGAESVVEEPNYFDRDYLSEFSGFYGVAARGFPNICRRLHFFSCKVDRQRLSKVLSNHEKSTKDLREHYLGFAVLRPIPWAPFGRTVLKAFPDHSPGTPRITQPMREYVAHLAGVELKVVGLAWQQQDTGVGACATIALWTALQSSAFDAHHAVPTTLDVTRAAHRTASLGNRVFPSSGLTIAQLCEAIKEHRLEPVISEGDLDIPGQRAFSRQRFSTMVAAKIRSGYPVILTARMQDDAVGHALCLVGFREAPLPAGAVASHLQDEYTAFLYLHDDNIGPNVRFAIAVDPAQGNVVLKAAAPTSIAAAAWPDATAGYCTLVPDALICAVHEDMRANFGRLHSAAAKLLHEVDWILSQSQVCLTLSAGVAVRRVAEYMREVLPQALGPSRELAAARLQLQEQVVPMSNHVGVVRIGVQTSAGPQPLLDVLFDTTEGDRLRAFCHVDFHPLALRVSKLLPRPDDLGTSVCAY